MFASRLDSRASRDIEFQRPSPFHTRFIPVSYPVSYPRPSYPRLGLRSFRLEPMTKRKLSQLGVREGRRARSSLRACLEQLRHGGPEAVVAALMGQLRKEERMALLEALRAACPETPDLSSHPAAQQATEAVTRAVAQMLIGLSTKL